MQNRRQRLVHVSFGVRVVDAQHELAAVVARVEPVEQGRPHPAYVEVAGR